jgi:hypothetical protein
MAAATIHCPHCKAPVTVEVGEDAHCPKCGGGLKVHPVGADEKDEQLRRLLGMVKLVERKDAPPDEPPPPPPKKRPWWKFWG